LSASLKLLHNSIQKFITNLYQWYVYSGVLPWQCRSFINITVSGSKLETIVQCFFCHSISVFKFDLFHSRKCVYSHTRTSYVFSKIPYMFSLGSLSILTNYQKLSTLSNEHRYYLYIFITACYACVNENYTLLGWAIQLVRGPH